MVREYGFLPGQPASSRTNSGASGNTDFTDFIDPALRKFRANSAETNPWVLDRLHGYCTGLEPPKNNLIIFNILGHWPTD